MIWLCGSISMMPTLYHHDPLASGQIRTTSSAGGPTRIFCSLWASATSTKGCFRDGRLEDHGRSPWRNRLTRWFLLTVGFLRLIYAQIPEVSSGCFPSFSAFHFLVYSIYEVFSKCCFRSCVIIRAYVGARLTTLSFWAHPSTCAKS